jgi:hypothetical protein
MIAIAKKIVEAVTPTPAPKIEPLAIGQLRNVNCCGMAEFYGLELLFRNRNPTVSFGDALIVELDWAVGNSNKNALAYKKRNKDVYNKYAHACYQKDNRLWTDEDRRNWEIWNAIRFEAPYEERSRDYTMFPALLAMSYRTREGNGKELSEALQKYISEHKLGVLGITGEVNNPNSGNTLIGMMWSIDAYKYRIRLQQLKPDLEC